MRIQFLEKQKIIMGNEQLTSADIKTFELSIDEKMKKLKKAQLMFDNLEIFAKQNRSKVDFIEADTNHISGSDLKRFIFDSANYIEDLELEIIDKDIFLVDYPKFNLGNCTTDRKLSLKDNSLELISIAHPLIKEIALKLAPHYSLISGEYSDKNQIDFYFHSEEDILKIVRYYNSKFSVIDIKQIFSKTLQSNLEDVEFDENIIGLSEKASQEIGKDYKLIGVYVYKQIEGSK